jgi:hypothetical protein
MKSSVRLIATVGIALVALSACSGEPSQTDTQAATSAPAEGGISADQAKRDGVFVAAYDARFEDQRAVSTSTGATLVLTNVGTSPDTYRIAVDPPSAGSVDPETVTLQPGQSARLAVASSTPAVVVARSDGRGGEPVAERTVGA